MGVYEHLGVRTRINAAANGTSIGGSIMLPEVVAAMQDAGRSYVSIPELLEKAGNRIAELAGVDACYITNGAAAGVVLSVAACMTGTSQARAHQLPDTVGMKDQVVVQRMQINFYELMIRLAGAKIVEVGLANRVYPWHLEAALNQQTAAIVHFPALGYPFNRTHPGRQFSRGGSLEGDPGSAGARAPGAAWATPPGAAWWR